MKTITIFILSILLSGSIHADCSFGGIYAFPTGETIQKNSLIIIEGYAHSQKIITALNKKHNVYLESTKHKVPLKVKQTLKGMYYLTQAILVPDEELVVGETYTLKIDSLKGEKLTRWNSNEKRYESIQWKVEIATDFTAPVALSNPILINKRFERYGCGPAVYADFKMQIKDSSEVLIKTELVDLDTKETYTYFIQHNNSDTISVGHDMCSGEFNYKEKGRYKIRFQLMDICGNFEPTYSEWLLFTSPYNSRF